MAISAQINVSDRPVTGQGVGGMRALGTSSGHRLVEDQSYFVGLLTKKIQDVGTETKRLSEEINQSGKDNSQFSQLEKRFEALLKNKEVLEGQLADYNLALDKTRTSTDPDDVLQMSVMLADKNKQNAQDLDHIFMQRKQREQDTQQLEEQIQKFHRAVQERVNQLEPSKQRAYSDLMQRKSEMEEKMHHNDGKLNEMTQRIRQFESDEKGHSHRREYVALEKSIQTLRREMQDVQEETAISELDPKEAHQRFVSRVNQHKQGTKTMEETIAQLKEEIASIKRGLEEVGNANSSPDDDAKEAEKYDLLFKRDQDMTAFIDKFDETREGVLREQNEAKDTVVALLEHISRTVDESSHMPSQDAVGEMQDAKTFKERNLVTAQKTMQNLQAERKKRGKELETLRNSEPKLIKEIGGLKEEMTRLNSELDDFEDIEGVKRRYERTKVELLELHGQYIKRRDGMRQQMQSVSAENEGLKKMLSSHDTGRELEETERRLKQAEKVIFDLKEFIDVKGRETDYEGLKSNCLKMSDALNAAAIRANKSSGGSLLAQQGMGQQAKW
jgi:intraflagellar transport protein 74